MCCQLGERPLGPWCCCGPKCAYNATLCKVKGTCCCLAIQGSFPCGSDTPILCTICPFLLVYPKVGCCETLDSAGMSPKPKKDEPKVDAEVRGAPPVGDEMER